MCAPGTYWDPTQSAQECSDCPEGLWSAPGAEGVEGCLTCAEIECPATLVPPTVIESAAAISGAVNHEVLAAGIIAGAPANAEVTVEVTQSVSSEMNVDSFGGTVSECLVLTASIADAYGIDACDIEIDGCEIPVSCGGAGRRRMQAAGIKLNFHIATKTDISTKLARPDLADSLAAAVAVKSAAAGLDFGNVAPAIVNPASVVTNVQYRIVLPPQVDGAPRHNVAAMTNPMAVLTTLIQRRWRRDFLPSTSPLQ